MKKALKISGITLASLVGLVLIVAVIAVVSVTSSGRLTRMVQKYAPRFITCEMQLEKADLTFFKTFPEVGIEIRRVAFINPMKDSPSDTLANIDKLIVVADIKKFLKEDEIIVKKCILEQAFVNIFTDEDGNGNFNVFNTKEDNDTTRSSFDYLVDIEEVKLKNTTLLYSDARSKMEAFARGLNLDVKGKMQDNDIKAILDITANALGLQTKAMQMSLNTMSLDFDGEVRQFDQIEGLLNLRTPDIGLNLGEDYLKNDTLNLNLPLKFSLKDLATHLDKAQIGLNQFIIQIDGDADVAENGDVNLDVNLNTGTLAIQEVLEFLPQKVQQSLSSISCSGKMNITEAEVKGTINDSLMPTIQAKVLTDNVTIKVPDLAYPFTSINLDALLALDLNNKVGNVEVNSLNAKFNKSDFKIKGSVKDLLGDLRFKLNLKGGVPMNDLKVFLPKNLKLGGQTDLNMDANFTLNQLLKTVKDPNLNRLVAKANMKIRNFSFDMDTIHAATPLLNVGLTLPASAKEKGRRGGFVTLVSDALQAKIGESINANIESFSVGLSADNIKKGIEKMDLDAALDFGQLDMRYDSISAKIKQPNITFVTQPTKHSKGLKSRITFNSKELETSVGKSYALTSRSLKVNASIDQNKDKTDFLNQWNPAADFVLDNAVVQVAGLNDNVSIDNISFLFNSHELDFKKSTFHIGKSDLSLQGSVIGVREWIEDHKNLMKGELALSSDLLDINEIMDLTSGLGRSDDPQPAAKVDDGEDNPFMVPEGVDFNFSIRTKKSLYDNFDLNNLSGTMTVKDGTLILQEIGFTNKAAEMQLTAMYQSPRKNNLFLAMDFHLLNVQINDLLNMIPYIDTLVPMLKTFDGQAEFHIGAETNLKSNYEPKISTLRAAADIEGRNLSVNDKFTFTKITDMLKVSNNGEYRVDSLDVQLTAFKNEIDLWPSQIAIGKYKVTVDGRMTLDKNGEYHLSVTESPLPVRLGLKISGPFNKLDYKIEDCKYPNLYKPNKRSDTEQMYYELKKKIADRLKSNVR